MPAGPGGGAGGLESRRQSEKGAAEAKKEQPKQGDQCSAAVHKNKLEPRLCPRSQQTSVQPVLVLPPGVA